MENRFTDEAASRAYYAAFHAATAAVLKEGKNFKTHRGAIAAFHRTFIKSGRLDVSLGLILNLLFELRSIGDYGEMTNVPESEARGTTEDAEYFIQLVEALIKESQGNP